MPTHPMLFFGVGVAGLAGCLDAAPSLAGVVDRTMSVHAWPLQMRSEPSDSGSGYQPLGKLGGGKSLTMVHLSAS